MSVSIEQITEYSGISGLWAYYCVGIVRELSQCRYELDLMLFRGEYATSPFVARHIDAGLGQA